MGKAPGGAFPILFLLLRKRKRESLAPARIKRLPAELLARFLVRGAARPGGVVAADGRRGRLQQFRVDWKPDGARSRLVIDDIDDTCRPIKREQSRARRVIDVNKRVNSRVSGQPPLAHLVREETVGRVPGARTIQQSIAQ